MSPRRLDGVIRALDGVLRRCTEIVDESARKAMCVGIEPRHRPGFVETVRPQLWRRVPHELEGPDVGAEVAGRAILTVNDHVLTGEAARAEGRERSFVAMVELRLDVAIGGERSAGSSPTVPPA
jgi:hypothetical protein